VDQNKLLAPAFQSAISKLQSKMSFRSFLTALTVMTAASGDHDSLDWSFADQARLAGASIDSVFQLEKPLFAIRTHVV